MDSPFKIFPIRAKVPNIKKLCHVVCYVDPNEIKNRSDRSPYSLRHMRCRWLMQMDPEVIARPFDNIPKDNTGIHVIMKKEHYGQLQPILAQLKIHVRQPVLVGNDQPGGMDAGRGFQIPTIHEYKFCLLYAIQSKMAPSWSVVGNYFIQGDKFYRSPEYSKAITNLNIRLIDGEIVEFAGTLANLEIPHIFSSTTPNAYVHVLPKLTGGKVLSVSRELPTDQFANYEEIRRHFRDMYGYSLPEDDHEIFYCDIQFFNFPKFTYPSVCLKRSETFTPMPFAKVSEAERIVRQFLSDLRNSVPSICGEPVDIYADLEDTALPCSAAESGYYSGRSNSTSQEATQDGGEIFKDSPDGQPDA